MGKLFFSLVSGEIYSVSDDEISNQGNDRIPLLKKPDSSCKKCYGRLYIGKHAQQTPNGVVHDYYIPCPRCLQKCLDRSLVTADTGRVEILQSSDNMLMTDDNEILQMPNMNPVILND